MPKLVFVFAALFASFRATAGELASDTTEAASNSAEERFWSRDNLFGDLGGFRSYLRQVGVGIDLQDVNGIWANLSGGLRRGVVYNGATTLDVSIDLERAVGWEGARTFFSAEWLRGLSPTRDLVGALQQVTQLDIGRPGLIDLWFDQDLLQRQLSVRIGQERPDDEFLLSPFGQVMINSTFGWPGLIDADIPLHNAAPMIRVAYNISDRIRLAMGAFRATSSDNRDALVIGEMQYTNGLSSYRFGGWYQTGSFPDQIFASWIHHSGTASMRALIRWFGVSRIRMIRVLPYLPEC